MQEKSEEQEKTEVFLHDFREQIDACIKKAESKIVKFNEETTRERSLMAREMALVRTKLQEAKMWTGKCLEAIDSPFPKELRDEAPPEQP